MKIQSKGCASGGIFQMEPERSDGQPTVFTHVLGPDAFYYDNPNFRARIGEVLNGTTVTARTNIGIEGASRFVGRDTRKRPRGSRSSARSRPSASRAAAAWAR
jgi:hypothetical protein